MLHIPTNIFLFPSNALCNPCCTNKSRTLSFHNSKVFLSIKFLHLEPCICHFRHSLWMTPQIFDSSLGTSRNPRLESSFDSSLIDPTMQPSTRLFLSSLRAGTMNGLNSLRVDTINGFDSLHVGTFEWFFLDSLHAGTIGSLLTLYM